MLIDLGDVAAVESHVLEATVGEHFSWGRLDEAVDILTVIRPVKLVPGRIKHHPVAIPFAAVDSDPDAILGIQESHRLAVCPAKISNPRWDDPSLTRRTIDELRFGVDMQRPEVVVRVEAGPCEAGVLRFRQRLR